MSVINTTIITGYLGVGKTTLINNLLSQNDGLRIAVIVNEFGDLGIDGDLILNTNEEIIELTNGCLCCSVRGDLINALISLKPKLTTLDALFIETSGLADPVPVAQTFLIGEDELQDFKLDAVITLIDARHGIPILKSEIEAILILCCFANLIRSGNRAISPSSFIISQITPEGFDLASLAISITASVCPALINVPPSLAINGKT